jgi:hypothetical protein
MPLDAFRTPSCWSEKKKKKCFVKVNTLMRSADFAESDYTELARRHQDGKPGDGARLVADRATESVRLGE